MWNRLNNEKKCYAVLAGMMLVLLVGYFTSLSKTMEAWDEHERLSQVGQSTSIAEFSVLQSRFQKLDSMYAKVALVDYDKVLIEDINLLIDRYKVDINALENEGIGSQEVDRVTFSGPYKELVKVLYHMEQNFFIGNLFSSEFRLEKNNKTKVTHLYLDIYLERINHEKGS